MPLLSVWTCLAKKGIVAQKLQLSNANAVVAKAKRRSVSFPASRKASEQHLMSRAVTSGDLLPSSLNTGQLEEVLLPTA
jgi:hypothetical protein